MSLYYQDEHVLLYHGDCLTEHREWLDADVLVTDPPYGIGWSQRAYKAVGRSDGNRSKAHGGIRNDSNLMARDTALQLFGTTKPGLVFGDILEEIPTGTKNVLVWQKPADSGLIGAVTWRKDWEPIFAIGAWPKGKQPASSIVGTGYGSHRQYAQNLHPHGKPIDTLMRLIEKCPPGVIADPFAGSGSTLLAARNLGRKAIGVELEESYCELTAKRLSQGAFDFGALV